MPNAVYDDEDKDLKKGNTPDDDELRRITGIGRDEEGAMDRQAGRGAAEDQERASLFNASGDATRPKSAGVNNPGADLSSVANLTPMGRAAKIGKFFLGSRRRKAATAGGIGVTGIAAGFMAFIILLFPAMRVNTLMENLQDHFFASAEGAVDKETNRLLTRYLVHKVMPGMATNKCNFTHVNRSCVLPSDAKTPVGALFNTWKDARLENKLANDYGIEIERNGRNEFTIKTPNMTTPQPLGDSDSPDFERNATRQLSRTELRNEIRHAFDGETRWKQVMYRFSYGKLLERKYGVRRCVLACEKRDKVTDSIAAKKVAFMSLLNERVIQPRSEMYSLIFDCAMSGFDCTGNKQVDKDGVITNEFDRDLQARLDDYRLRVGDRGLEDIDREAKDLREKGITQYLVGKLLGETTAKLAAKGIPVIGWLDLGFTIIDGAQNIGPALKKITYATYAATAVETYMLYRTAADEVKADKTDATALGSISDSLNADPMKDQGGLSGEESPFYKSLTGETTTPLALGDLSLMPTASAAAPKVGPYTCDDGKKPPSGELCPEEKVGAESMVGTVTKYLSQVMNSPMYFIQGLAADFWKATVGQILKAAGWLIGKGLGAAAEVFVPEWVKNKIADISKAVTETIISHVIVNPLTDKPSGARLLNVAAAGADFSANDFAHNELGGKVLSDHEVATIRNERINEEKQQFANQPLFARIFSTDSQYSMISRMAVATPSNFQGFFTKASSFLTSNPFSTLVNGFGTFLAPPSASAADGEDPFGIPQYGYTDADIAAIGDEEAYWEANCTDLTATNQAWGNTATENPDTGQFDNATTNACKLIETAVASAGGKYNTDLIPEYGQEADGGNVGDISAGPIDQSTVFTDSTSIPCAPGTKDLGIQDGYHDGVKVPIRICAIIGMKSSSGESHDQYGVTGAGGDTVVNSRVAANVLAMFKAAKQDGVVLSVSSSFRTMAHQQSLCPCDGRGAAKPGFSNHQMGLAIDFSEPSVSNRNAQTCATRVKDEKSAQWNWLEDNAARFGFKQYSAESWHWDVLASSNRCGGDGT